MQSVLKEGGFWVSRIAGLTNFCAQVSGISFKTSYFSGFQSHIVHEIEIRAFEGLKRCTKSQ